MAATIAIFFHEKSAGGRKIPCFTRLWGATFLVLACLLVPTFAQAATQEVLPEYQVKAAYLFNFLKFVEWPDDTFADPLAPFVIGVVGDDPFGSALPQVVTGKTVQGRDLVIRLYRPDEDLRGAQILFISASERKKFPAILAGLRGSTVLTVADTPGFLDAGGMIQFISESQRVRFGINAEAASRARLKISAKLLSLAKVIGGIASPAGN